MPSVIAPRIQESLVNSSSHEMLVDEIIDSHLLGSEHVIQGVSVVLEPKFVVSEDSVCRIPPFKKIISWVYQRIGI